jgi:sialate O-acetylesterase
MRLRLATALAMMLCCAGLLLAAVAAQPAAGDTPTAGAVPAAAADVSDASGRWVGPLANFYNSSACPMVGPVHGPFPPAAALAKCEQLCASTRGCNAMNIGTGFGLPHAGCALRRCLTKGALTAPSLHVAGVSGYYCNATDPLQPGSCMGAAPLPPPPPPAAAAVTLHSVFASSMVLQHGKPARIAGQVTTKLGGLEVTVELDGKVAGRGMTATDGSFAVTIAAQPAGSTPHVLRVQASGSGTQLAITPATISDVLFGELYLCSGQSNMKLAVQSVDNATAEVAAADWPLIRIAAVAFTGAATPQNDTRFTIPWGAVTSKNVGGFSGVCYYFGRRMFTELARGDGGNTPIGLVEQAVGGTYIESFMTADHMAPCNTTGRMPKGWTGAPPKLAGGKPCKYTINQSGINQAPECLGYLLTLLVIADVPWGGANIPAALWNSMIAPLLPLRFKLAIYDQAEQNLATNESLKYHCLQNQLVGAWREAWGAELTFHAVQLPSLNMTEFAWIYIDPQRSLGQMRLSQAATMRDVPRTTLAVTIDLADLHSPFGSVHNRQKQEVGRRLALNALATVYARSVNTGPTLKTVAQAANKGGLLVTISSKTAGIGHFSGSNDCIECCAQSAFEVSTDGSVWSRAKAQAIVKAAGSDVQITLNTGTPRATWLRYGFDALVQCPYFDDEKLPLGPFSVAVVAGVGGVGGGGSTL